MLSLGKLLTEEQGRLTVRRVLSVDGGSAKVETTWESAGTFNDVHYTDLGTLWSFIRPDGTRYGEWKGKAVLTTTGMSNMTSSRPRWVTDTPLTTFECGQRAGEPRRSYGHHNSGGHNHAQS